MAKLNFQQATPVFSVTWSFRELDMLICCSKDILIISYNVENFVLLNIYVETMGHFFMCLKEYKESLLTIDQFNASLLNVPNPKPYH